MRSQLVIVLLVGLAASAYALDLSHAHKRSIETEPRLFSLLTDFYAQVVYPPLNHVVTNLALLGAQVLAGISQTGIPSPGGRVLHPTDAQLRGFFDDLWNNALKPPLENALSGGALMLAQVLAGVGVNGINLGKRDLSELAGREDELRGFFDTLGQGLLDSLQTVWTNVLQNPLQNALQSSALMAAQVLAGLGVNGVDLSSILGKRDLTEEEMRGFLDTMADAFNSVFTNVLQKPLENALSGGALMLAQVLAGAGVNGIDLSSLFGKRDLTEEEMRGFLDTMADAFNSVFTNVLQKPLENALSGGALMLAQVLAGAGVNGIDLSSLFGKRDLTEEEMRGFLDTMADAFNSVFTNVLQKPLENALSGGALMLAQVLAGAGVNGIDLSSLFGKRDLTEEEMRGFLDTMADAFNSVFTNVLQKPLENALSGGALMLAQVLAGAGVNGIDLSSLFGKRDLTEEEMRGFLDTMADAFNSVFTNVLQKPLENALSGGALMLAQVLAGAGVNGIDLSSLFGKRDLTEEEMRGFLDTMADAFNSVFTNVLQKPLENALSGGALMLAQVLAGAGVNGIDLSSLFGKRDLTEEEMRGFLDTMADAFNSVFTNVLQKPLENALSGGALMLAQVLAGAGVNGIDLSSLFGKRDATSRGPVINDLLSHATGLVQTQVKPVLENALNAAALHLASVLANFSQNTIGRR